jgi:hypothetical protein
MVKSRRLGISGFLFSSLLLFGLTTFHAGAEELGACVQKNKGNMRLVSGPQACNSSETYVVWNTQGPQGDTGPQGEKGDTGPQGEKGDTGDAGPPALATCEGRIEQFTLIWNGSDGISITPQGGLVVSSNIANNGDEVTFSSDGTLADQSVFLSGAVNGESTFHLSGSDKDMNADNDNNAQLQVIGQTLDCGKFEGDAKDNSSSHINEWLLEGLVCENGYVLDCTSVGDL